MLHLWGDCCCGCFRCPGRGCNSCRSLRPDRRCRCRDRHLVLHGLHVAGNHFSPVVQFLDPDHRPLAGIFRGIPAERHHKVELATVIAQSPSVNAVPHAGPGSKRCCDRVAVLIDVDERRGPLCIVKVREHVQRMPGIERLAVTSRPGIEVDRVGHRHRCPWGDGSARRFYFHVLDRPGKNSLHHHAEEEKNKNKQERILMHSHINKSGGAGQ